MFSRCICRRSLALGFYAFLGVERFSFVDFVRDLEDEALKKISVHLQAALCAHTPSLPGSSRLIPSAPTPPPVSAMAASASVAFDGSSAPSILPFDGSFDPHSPAAAWYFFVSRLSEVPFYGILLPAGSAFRCPAGAGPF